MSRTFRPTGDDWSRRRFALGLSALGLSAIGSAACSKFRSSGEGAAPPNPSRPGAPRAASTSPSNDGTTASALHTSSLRVDEWTLESAAFGTVYAAIIVPKTATETKRLPLVIALHGRGESLKAPQLGALGWPNDYALTHAMDRVGAPPLTANDYEGFIGESELGAVNAGLLARPFQGLVIACPYLPDLDPRADAAVGPYAAALTDELLPRVRREAPVLASPAAIGIDGVSHGGIVALRIGFMRPAVFGAIGALQPALRVGDAPAFTDLVRVALAKKPSLRLRLTTSDEDSFLAATSALSTSWSNAGVVHTFEKARGPHDYGWNRGPGAYSMLLFHDRALART